MQDVTELLFKITTKDDRGLDRANDAIKKIAASSKLGGAALEAVESEVRKAFEEMSASGLRFEQVIARLGQSANRIGKEPAAAARELKKELDAAAAGAKNLADRQRDLRNAGSGLQTAIVNPLAAAENAAIRTASALGPVGIGIAAAGTAAVITGKQLFDLVESEGKAAEQLGNLASRLGLTVNQTSELSAEAQIAGVNINSLAATSRYLGAALEDPAGSGKKVAIALREMETNRYDTRRRRWAEFNKTDRQFNPQHLDRSALYAPRGILNLDDRLLS